MLTIEQLINEYVDDLNAGEFPRVYEHMENNPNYDWESVLPLLEFITYYKYSNASIPEHIKQSILYNILQ